jgi:pre-rRNA-processing protein TSR1
VHIHLNAGLAKMGTFWNGPLKRWVTLAPTPTGDIGRVLDLVRVADTVLFAMSATEPVTEFGTLCTTAIKALGTASMAHLVVDLDASPPKRRGDLKKAAIHAAQSEFPETRVHTLEAGKDPATTVWQVANQKHKALPWRDGHPYLLAQDIQFIPAGDGSETGTLLVSG